jgi:hypothetical protein
MANSTKAAGATHKVEHTAFEVITTLDVDANLFYFQPWAS